MNKQEGGLSCKHQYLTPHRPTFYNMTATSERTFQTPASAAMRSRLPLQFERYPRVLAITSDDAAAICETACSKLHSDMKPV